MEKVFDILIGLHLDHYTGRRANVDRLLSKNKGKYIGPYGTVTAGLMSIEEQSGSSLHGHASLFGSWDIDVIERYIHDRTFRNQLVDLIDSIITCKTPDNIKNDPPAYPYPVFGSLPYPKPQDVDSFAASINSCLNHHKDSFTC